MKENKVFWRQWLNKYKSFNCLWDSAVETTSSKKDAWKELIDMAKSVNNEADAYYVRARLKKFIYIYKLEAKKVDVAKANGIQYESKNFVYKIFKSINESKEREKADCQATIQLNNKSVFKKNWRKVLKLYVYYKRIWDKNECPQNEEMAGWRKITNIARLCYPKASVDSVKSRITNCFSNYLKEERKLNDAKRNGFDYKPKLFYFNVLKKLKQDGSVQNLHDSDDCVETNDDFEDAKMGIEKESKNTKERRWSGDKKVWRKILKRYVSLKCLWDSENQKSYTMTERAVAWRELLRIIQKSNSNADLTFLRSRIHNSRCVFKREFNKTAYEKQNGREYKSKLFYYDILYVLYQNENKVFKFSTEESSSEDEPIEPVEMEQNKKPTIIDPKLQALEAELKQRNLIFAPLVSNPQYFERKIWLNVIKKYVYSDCLWNTENKDYYNHDQRNNAWQILAEIAKRVNPNADINYVKTRIKHYRSVYARQLKLAQTAKANGKDFDIKLFYFNALSPIYQKNFPILNYDNDDVVLDESLLDNNSTLNPKSNTYYPDDESDEKEEVEIFEDEEKVRMDENNIETLESAQTQPYENNVVLNKTHILKRETFKKPEVLRSLRRKEPHLNNEPTTSSSGQKQSIITAAFKKRIAKQLLTMDEKQYLLAEKLITEVCILGRKKKLTEKSSLLFQK